MDAVIPFPPPDADAAQLRASDPAVSAFVSASAGSGKTKLLTDRLLRLMLADPAADPARIQCLTFTKAAAAEMANRLQRRLADWVVADDVKLDCQLRALRLRPDEAMRRDARALFARVLDLPGGMRIGTLHAFCQSLLRRFPLEAALSPHFRLLEGADEIITRRQAQEDMLGRGHPDWRGRMLERIAGLVSLADFTALVGIFESHRERLRAADALSHEALPAALDRVTGADRTACPDHFVRWEEEATLRDALEFVAREGAEKTREGALKMLDWLARHHSIRAACWDEWIGHFFRENGKRKTGIIRGKLGEQHPHLLEALEAEQARIETCLDKSRAANVSDLSAALIRLAAPVAAAYRGRKETADAVDFADLIARTQAILHEPGAAWVRYKLDGGLDHLLLDEVQDTSPEQWAIAGALTEDFLGGPGAPHRTVFAVGDRKQSIFSFQGADPASFDAWRGVFRARAAAVGAPLREQPLDVSFRSAPPILALVDRVFENPLAAQGVRDGAPIGHAPHRVGAAGRVELWPLTPVPETEAAKPWASSDRNRTARTPQAQLAEQVASWIRHQTDGTVPLESAGRMLTPGDVLVLVRKRGAFSGALVRALKRLAVPVAGLDRMKLTDEPAVADLLALCDALLLPEDDLQFAAMLTSPLGFLSDESLMHLALDRAGTLRDALRARAGERADWRDAAGFFAALLARVDYVTPHALLVEALGPLGGRARLLARLGPEAADPIDEMLAAALAYVRTHPPSLQGFVQWLRRSGTEVKRETEAAGSMVRIMTVHGAKGLEAPLVILPDTTGAEKEPDRVHWVEQDGLDLPLWSPANELNCAAYDRARDTAKRRQREENNRLLYVALTRARDRLLVCGWKPQKGKEAAESCWYELVRTALEGLDGVLRSPFGEWPGDVLERATPQTAPPDEHARARGHAASPLPAWAGAAPAWRPAPPPVEPALPQPLAPSRPEDATLGPVPPAASPLAARDTAGKRFRRGRLVHSLLQHLPELPLPERRAAATRFVERPGNGLAPDEAAHLVADVFAVLDHPDLAPLFGPDARAEVPLTGVVAGSVVGGLVDRLAVLPDRVLFADYKTNRTPPTAPEQVPVLYLRQMAAYRAVLRGVFPDRIIACSLVWTVGARVMPLPDPLLDAHAPSLLRAAGG